MNMGVMETGPVISMPGLRRSSGTGGTCHGSSVMALRGGLAGSLRSRRAERAASARASRAAVTRGAKASCMCAR